MKGSAKQVVAVLLIHVAVLMHSAHGQDEVFRHVQVRPEIALDVPSHWAEWSPDGRRNLDAAGEAVVANATNEPLEGEKRLLFALNSTPTPTGAMVRVSTTSPAYMTQDDVLRLTPAELEEIGVISLTGLRQLEGAGGPKILEFEETRIENVASRPALVTSYVRSSAMGPSSWYVTQYRIPMSDQVVELTLSHRQSDAIVWRPILERVKRSLSVADVVPSDRPRSLNESASEGVSPKSKGTGVNGLVVFFTILFLVGGSYLRRRSASNRGPSEADT